MTTVDDISSEEMDAIEQLGGWESCKALTDKILAEYGIHRSLLGQPLRGHVHAVSSNLHLDMTREASISANLADLFRQAGDIQREAGGTNYVGAMLQHLVGAKLELVLGEGAVEHHGASVADHSTNRNADFDIHGVAIHVTTHPSEVLMRKAVANLKAGLRPLIVTLGDGVAGAAYLLKDTEWADRIDVLDAAQFLMANVYERSLFRAGECKITLQSIVEQYNRIVESCETDPVLLIRVMG